MKKDYSVLGTRWKMMQAQLESKKWVVRQTEAKLSESIQTSKAKETRSTEAISKLELEKQDLNAQINDLKAQMSSWDVGEELWQQLDQAHNKISQLQVKNKELESQLKNAKATAGSSAAGGKP